MGVPQKTKTRTTEWYPEVSLLGIHPKEIDLVNWRDISTIVHNNHDMETTQVFLADEQIKKM